MMVIGSLVLVLTVVGVGWRYWAIGQEKAQVAREIDAAKREEARLQEILKQVQEFENRRKLLEARVALIDELRKGQSAPVHMIDQISKALPDMTWLTDDAAERLHACTMQGRCLTLTSLSDFIGNLEASRYFIRPGGNHRNQDRRPTTSGPELIIFTIRGTFQMAGVESVAPPPPGAKGGRGGKRG